MSFFEDDNDFDDLEIASNDEMEQEEIENFDLDDSSEESSDLIDQILADRGIKDRNDIKFEDENGQIQSRAWDDLSIEEQRNILSYDYNYDPEEELNDEEIDFINYLRSNGITPQQYVQAWNESTQNAYQSGQQSVTPESNSTFAVDDFSNDDLFILDLQARNENITDEEALEMLNNAKLNESLFEKQIEGLRNEYRQLEQNKQQQEEAERNYQQEQEFQEFSNNIVENINGLSNFGSLDIDLDDDDKEELASFILDKDETGVSYLGKALNDPQTLVQMAWFALHGEKTFNEIDRYMTETIRRSAQAAYNKGLNEGRNSRSRVAVSKHNTNTNKQASGLDDLDF